MDIITMTFDDKLIITINNQKVTLTVQHNAIFEGVSLGIDAPRQIAVDREEIHYQKKNKN
jgi:carbon storage regulator